MIRTSSVYEKCHDLFATYPLAVRAADDSETIHLMILMLQDGDAARFLVLSDDRRDGASRYALRPWRAQGTEIIEAGSGEVSDLAVNAVTKGAPIPQGDSLFGWRAADALTALLVVYTTYTPARPEPSWAVMPLAGSPEVQWPPFTRDRLFGHWFWEHYWAGNIVSATGLIAGTADTVFWIDTRAILGSDCCVVARDVRSPGEPVLRQGRYVYHEVLRDRKPVPSLETLLADPSKVDLASRFGQSDSDCGETRTRSTPPPGRTVKRQ
jgi:hypothetical protein